MRQNGEIVRQMANNFNLDDSQARAAVAALVPAPARGVRNNSGSPQGLQDLPGALTRGQPARWYQRFALDVATLAAGR